MSSRRGSISKRIRFEVFKRDRFRCAYCGAAAPDAVLDVKQITASMGSDVENVDFRMHIDHITPRALGGADDIFNYVTACAACNLGKAARALSDDSVLVKQRAQIDLAAARREQLEMFGAWQRELAALDSRGVDVAADLWASLVPGRTVTVVGRDQLATLLRRFGAEAVLDAMRVAVRAYAKRDIDGSWVDASLQDTFEKIGGICMNARRQADEPDLPKLYAIRGILRHRFAHRCYDAEAIRLLRRASKHGVAVERLEEFAHEASSYWRWKTEMEEYITDASSAPPASPSLSTTPTLVTAPPPVHVPTPVASSWPPLALAAAERIAAALQRRGIADIRLDDIVLRLNRETYTSTLTLWIRWTEAFAQSFVHWCAVMDWVDAMERIEEATGQLPALAPTSASADWAKASTPDLHAARLRRTLESVFGAQFVTDDDDRRSAYMLSLGCSVSSLEESMHECRQCGGSVVGWRGWCSLVATFAAPLITQVSTDEAPSTGAG